MNTLKLMCAAGILLVLQGCAAAVVAGGATAVTSANDRRTLGAQIDEELPLLVLLQQRRYAAQLRIHQAVTAPERILAGQHGGARSPWHTR